jgi:hypothetical protein
VWSLPTARGRRGRQNVVTRSGAFLGNVESSGTRSERCSARCYPGKFASWHLPWNAVDVRVLGRSSGIAGLALLRGCCNVLPISQSAHGLEPFAGAEADIRSKAFLGHFILHAQLLGAGIEYTTADCEYGSTFSAAIGAAICRGAVSPGNRATQGWRFKKFLRTLKC